jgi:hypothetical protein
MLQYTFGGAYIAKFVSCKTVTSFDFRVVDLTRGLLNGADPNTNLGTFPRLGLPSVIQTRVSSRGEGHPRQLTWYSCISYRKHPMRHESEEKLERS